MDSILNSDAKGTTHDFNHPEESHVAQTASTVLRDFVAGAYNEAKDHPLKLAGEAVAGVAITFGTVALSPELAAAAGVAGLCYGAYEATGALMHAADAAKVIDNNNGTFTKEQVKSAHLEIRHLGAESADMAAVAAGGGMARVAGGQIAKVVCAPLSEGYEPHWSVRATLGTLYNVGALPGEAVHSLPAVGNFLALGKVGPAVLREIKQNVLNL